MKTQGWFLPESPDVLGMLKRQFVTTGEGVDALVTWAHGDASKANVARALEHEGDEHKRQLEVALRTAFTTPLERRICTRSYAESRRSSTSRRISSVRAR